MNRYPLNTVAVNGTRTRYGAGTAGMSLTQSSAGFLFAHGRVGGMQVSSGMQASGLNAQVGSGVAAQQMGLSGVGYRRTFGVGNAQVRVWVDASAQVLPWMGSFLRMRMRAYPRGVAAPRMVGMSAVTLGVRDESINPITVCAQVRADMKVRLRYGIPDGFTKNPSTALRYMDSMSVSPEQAAVCVVSGGAADAIAQEVGEVVAAMDTGFVVAPDVAEGLLADSRGYMTVQEA